MLGLPQHPARGNPPWKLADQRAGQGTPDCPGPIDAQGQAGLRHPGHPGRLRPAPGGVRRARCRYHPVAGRAVGAVRSRRKRAPGSHGGYSGMGEAGNQRLDDRRGRRRRETAPGGVERRQGQREHEWLGRLVGGRAIRQGDRDRALRAHDLRRTCAKLCRKNGGNIEQIKFLLSHSSIQTTERYLGSEQDIEIAVNDNLGLLLVRRLLVRRGVCIYLFAIAFCLGNV